MKLWSVTATGIVSIPESDGDLESLSPTFSQSREWWKDVGNTQMWFESGDGVLSPFISFESLAAYLERLFTWNLCVLNTTSVLGNLPFHKKKAASSFALWAFIRQQTPGSCLHLELNNVSLFLKHWLTLISSKLGICCWSLQTQAPHFSTLLAEVGLDTTSGHPWPPAPCQVWSPKAPQETGKREESEVGEYSLAPYHQGLLRTAVSLGGRLQLF